MASHPDQEPKDPVTLQDLVAQRSDTKAQVRNLTRLIRNKRRQLTYEPVVKKTVWEKRGITEEEYKADKAARNREYKRRSREKRKLLKTQKANELSVPSDPQTKKRKTDRSGQGKPTTTTPKTETGGESQ